MQEKKERMLTRSNKICVVLPQISDKIFLRGNNFAREYRPKLLSQFRVWSVKRKLPAKERCFFCKKNRAKARQFLFLAQRRGFEPPEPVTVRTLSKRVP